MIDRRYTLERYIRAPMRRAFLFIRGARIAFAIKRRNRERKD
jgi:hypothetical protein